MFTILLFEITVGHLNYRNVHVDILSILILHFSILLLDSLHYAKFSHSKVNLIIYNVHFSICGNSLFEMPFIFISSGMAPIQNINQRRSLRSIGKNTLNKTEVNKNDQKRKAENSPPKDKTLKRSAFVDITNVSKHT